jgi:hypothetical protein
MSAAGIALRARQEWSVGPQNTEIGMEPQSNFLESPLSIRAPGSNLPSSHPSAELLARAQHGWDAFLTRTGPLPGEGEDIEHRRHDDESAGR